MRASRRVAERDVVELAGLAAEAKPDRRARDSRVAGAHRRQAERLVVARVLLVADANQRLLEELHDGGDDLVARQAGQRDVGVGLPPQRRQRGGEVEDAIVLGLVPYATPARVIAMLLAPARVSTGRLQVAARVRTDPHAAPRRRDHQPSDSVQLSGVSNNGTVRVHIAEAFAHSLPRDAGRTVGHVTETRGRCRVARLDADSRRHAPLRRNNEG